MPFSWVFLIFTPFFGNTLLFQFQQWERQATRRGKNAIVNAMLRDPKCDDAMITATVTDVRGEMNNRIAQLLGKRGVTII